MPDADSVRAPAPEQWALILEANPDAPAPMAVLMRVLVKHLTRYSHLRVVRVCNDVPYPLVGPVEFTEE